MPPAGFTSKSAGIKSVTSAGGFLKRLIKQAPFKITKLLTDNGKEFTDRFCATGERHPTGACPPLIESVPITTLELFLSITL